MLNEHSGHPVLYRTEDQPKPNNPEMDLMSDLMNELEAQMFEEGEIDEDDDFAN